MVWLHLTRNRSNFRVQLVGFVEVQLPAFTCNWLQLSASRCNPVREREDTGNGLKWKYVEIRGKFHLSPEPGVEIYTALLPPPDRGFQAATPLHFGLKGSGCKDCAYFASRYKALQTATSRYISSGRGR